MIFFLYSPFPEVLVGPALLISELVCSAVITDVPVLFCVVLEAIVIAGVGTFVVVDLVE